MRYVVEAMNRVMRAERAAISSPVVGALRSAIIRAPAWLAPLALCAAWVLFTLVGHDPWKPDEAYSLGVVLDFLERGDWVVPTLAGEPFLEKPPLFFVTAGVFARVFGGILPLHDAARLASGFYMALALIFLGMTARELHRGRHGWTAVLLMLGCLGLTVRAHQLITDLALLAGTSMGIFGLAYGRRNSIGGGFALGAGVAIAFLSKGILGPGVLALGALLLPMFPAWRQRTYARTLAVAAVVALPGIAAWSIALYLRSPDLFNTWLITNNFGRFLGFTKIGPHQPRYFYAYTILWYAFPALPLAAWVAWGAFRRRNDAQTEPGVQLPLVLFAVMASVLGAASDARELYLMPTLLPLALLATAGIDRFPPVAASGLATLGKGVFGVLAVGLWLGWIALLTGAPAFLAETLAHFQPGFVARFSWPAFVLALLATIVWSAVAWPRAVSAQRSILQWTAGVTLSVCLVGTLWLPYLDAGKSYREMIRSLLEFVPEKSCVASRHRGEPQRALLYYFGKLKTVREEVVPQTPCRSLLVQGWRDSDAATDYSGWTPVWEGARPGDSKEIYRLYVRGPSASDWNSPDFQDTSKDPQMTIGRIR
jgi:4-amino-4-deoxy-L-arabinose transferase-like glycosyltransferase